MTRQSLVPFLLPADPTQPLEAATKQYVDGKTGGGPFMPTSGGMFTGPISYQVGVGPTSPNHMTDKEYVDGQDALSVPLTGKVNMSGYLLINDLSSQNQLYIQGVGPAHQVVFRDSAGAQLGYISVNDAEYLRVAADVGPIYLRCGSVDNLTVGATQINAEAQTRIAGGVQSLILADAGSGPYVGMYDGASTAAIGTRKGYMGFTSATLLSMVNEVGSTAQIRINSGGTIDFFTAGAREMLITAAGDVLTQKGAVDTGVMGCQLGSSGRIAATTATATAYNFISNIIGAVDNNIHMSLRRSDVIVGSIMMNGTTGITYQTTSDARLKGNVFDLDDDEAIEHLMLWRPVGYQWRLSETGEARADAEPSGPVEHGFLAQELYEVSPSAVSVGTGEWQDHLDWQRGRAIWPALYDDVDPFSPWQADNSTLVPDMVAAMQAMMRRIQTLEAQVASLSA